ncbi:MAG TPA: L-lysine 6-transaminase [Sphingobacteriaceae bacterium]|nr:L-lysine 6-transaminase [Sphingobacteriaceae bacterium]
MYSINVDPKKVHETLGKHILADGYDLTFDLDKSQGSIIYDSKYERELLDMFTCFASIPLGYNHPKMLNDENFQKSLLKAAINNPSNSDVYTVEYAEFIKTFNRVAMPEYLHHAFFVAGGGLAVENALKVAMDWKVQKNFQKGHTKEIGTQVIHFEQAFHGRTGYTMSLTNTLEDKTKWFAKFDWPRISNPMIHFPITEENLPDLIARENKSIEEIKKAFADNKDDICAIIIEPVQAEGGDHHFRTEFMEQLRKLADENEVMLIYDEVQTGVGLSGKFWLHEHYGENARPDIISFGKKMQICGILAGPKVDEIETNVFNVSSRINSTWGGNLVDMVRSTKILQIIEEENLLQNVSELGEYLLDRMHDIQKEFPMISNVRGKGLLAAFDFENGTIRNQFISEGMKNGAMFLGCGDQSVRFRPALNITKAELERALEILVTTLKGL